MKRLAFLALFAAGAARAATISGTVTGDTNQPLGSMTVTAYTAAGVLQSSGATTASGTYSLAVPAGTYRVLAFDPAGALATSFYAEAESFETSSTLTLTAAQNATNINFRLVRAGFAVGRVSDAAGAALANITVAAYNLSGTRRGFTTTGAAGNFTLALPPGTYKIGAYDEELTYAPAFFDDAMSFDTATTIAIAANAASTANLQLALAAVLTGRVTDRISGAPLAGITAAAYNADGTTRAFATTDDRGVYSIVVPAGDDRLGAFDAALVYLPQFYANQTSFANATIVHAAAQQTIGGFDFALTKGARVTGRVTSRPLGTPLGGMTVGVYDPAGRRIASTTTDAAGRYTLLLTPATVKLLVFDDTLQFARAYYLDAPTFEASQALPLVEGQSLIADFAMSEAGTIRGVVLSATTLAPLANISVIIYDLDLRSIADATTDAHGAFRVAVPAGTYLAAAGDPTQRYTSSFYGGGNGSIVHVSAHQETGPLEIRLAPATGSSRRRAVSH